MRTSTTARSRREVSLQSQAAILAAIGVDAADEQAAAAAIHQHETVRWTRLLPPVVVVEVGEPLIVPVAVPLELDATWLEWRIKFEDGKQRRGVARLDKLQVIEEGSAEDRAYRRLSLKLPDLPLGYHTATIALDTGLSGELRLIVAHAQCYRAARDHSGRAGVGHRCAALRAALAAQLGHGRFSRSARAGASRRAARLRHRRPQSAARADAGESGAHQSLQPVESSVPERALHQRRGRAGLRRVRRRRGSASPTQTFRPSCSDCARRSTSITSASRRRSSRF